MTHSSVISQATREVKKESIQFYLQILSYSTGAIGTSDCCAVMRRTNAEGRMFLQLSLSNLFLCFIYFNRSTRSTLTFKEYCSWGNNSFWCRCMVMKRQIRQKYCWQNSFNNRVATRFLASIPGLFVERKRTKCHDVVFSFTCCIVNFGHFCWTAL